jgi:hypothetical protein
MNATWGVVLFATAVDEQHSQDVKCGSIPDKSDLQGTFALD